MHEVPTAYLEGVRASDVGRKAGEGLLAGATHTDQQRGAARHGHQAGDAHQMVQRVREQHKLQLQDLCACARA